MDCPLDELRRWEMTRDEAREVRKDFSRCYAQVQRLCTLWPEDDVWTGTVSERLTKLVDKVILTVEQRDEALAAMSADTADVVLAKCVAERERDEARDEAQWQKERNENNVRAYSEELEKRTAELQKARDLARRLAERLSFICYSEGKLDEDMDLLAEAREKLGEVAGEE